MLSGVVKKPWEWPIEHNQIDVEKAVWSRLPVGDALLFGRVTDAVGDDQPSSKGDWRR